MLGSVVVGVFVKFNPNLWRRLGLVGVNVFVFNPFPVGVFN
jgi:hypothetical protein